MNLKLVKLNFLNSFELFVDSGLFFRIHFVSTEINETFFEFSEIFFEFILFFCFQ